MIWQKGRKVGPWLFYSKWKGQCRLVSSKNLTSKLGKKKKVFPSFKIITSCHIVTFVLVWCYDLTEIAWGNLSRHWFTYRIYIMIPSILDKCFFTLPAQPWQWRETRMTTTCNYSFTREKDYVTHGSSCRTSGLALAGMPMFLQILA